MPRSFVQANDRTRPMLRRTVVVIVVVSLFVGVGALVVSSARSASATTISKSLRSAVAGLPVAAENRSGYSRSLFKHWIDADHDGCDTRREVLIVEAVKRPTRGASCSLTGGKWYSYYDGEDETRTTALDIDHLVALAEAWDSGARNWSAKQREAYANDLGDTRSLVAVTASVNRSKSDRDPVDWLPPKAAVRCQYTRQWVAVKLRWKLKVNASEKDKLTHLAAGCPNVTITVTIAPVLGGTTTTTTKPTSNCSPAYPDFCIPPPPPDLDCADVAPHHNFKVLAPDPHGFDGNNNGKGCES